jgi:uncharacterized membrane protein
MKLTKADSLYIIIIVLTFISSILIFPYVPSKVPIHWNIYGEVDSYSNKSIGLFILPVFLLFIFVILFFIPKFEVFKENLESFKRYFEHMKVAILLFFLFIYVITMLPNFGIKYNITYLIVPAVAALLYYIGSLLKHTRRNYFIGIRTPWTLADDEVWRKTHEAGSISFRINAIILLIAMINAQAMFFVLLASIIINVIFLYVYSYRLWKESNRKKKR